MKRRRRRRQDITKLVERMLERQEGRRDIGQERYMKWLCSQAPPLVHPVWEEIIAEGVDPPESPDDPPR